MTWTAPIDLPPEEPIHTPSPEEILEHFRELIKSDQQEAPQLSQIISVFQNFLCERPEPPIEWQKRFAEHGGIFDYHQICLPEDIIDPYLDEAENLQRLLDLYGNESYLSLEHFLLTRNHFIFLNGHAPAIHCPRPVLMLESQSEDQDVDWDCTATFFADGSVASYNLEGEREENLGRDAREILAIHLETLRKLAVRVPVEGEDFGDLSQNDSCI